ncbi:hypothetical protein B0H17DRAFT_1128364 [Mycena rosella]|uniref:Uncharacterized protein n=1 Tax=Mycena rosella TaxID=1033263 RepID=A0AAD7DXU8_MYCRO|nr:hypothetical protein B0H17DRAFT_1128364 [Mycena rosella]
MQVLSRLCQAEDSDGEECDCETFAPSKNDPKICHRCLHRSKHHPEIEDTISSIVMKVQTDAESGVFSKMSLEKRKTLDGMRPKKPKSKPASSRWKAPAKSTKTRAAGRPAREPASMATFKVDAIILLVDGVTRRPQRTKLELVDDSVPDNAEIQILVNQGLAARKDDKIEIPLHPLDTSSWPHGYFDHLGPNVFANPTTESSLVVTTPPWVLCMRVRQRLEIVQVASPTGRDVHTHRGPKNPTENQYMFISSRAPIPNREKASWYTADFLAFTMPHKSESAGSDEEHDEGGVLQNLAVRKFINLGQSDARVEDQEEGQVP